MWPNLAAAATAGIHPDGGVLTSTGSPYGASTWLTPRGFDFCAGRPVDGSWRGFFQRRRLACFPDNCHWWRLCDMYDRALSLMHRRPDGWLETLGWLLLEMDQFRQTPADTEFALWLAAYEQLDARFSVDAVASQSLTEDVVRVRDRLLAALDSWYDRIEAGGDSVSFQRDLVAVYRGLSGFAAVHASLELHTMPNDDARYQLLATMAGCVRAVSSSVRSLQQEG